MESRERGKAIFAAQALIYHARQEEGRKFGQTDPLGAIRIPYPYGAQVTLLCFTGKSQILHQKQQGQI